MLANGRLKREDPGSKWAGVFLEEGIFSKHIGLREKAKSRHKTLDSESD
jgi:hypothetical protein